MAHHPRGPAPNHTKNPQRPPPQHPAPAPRDLTPRGNDSLPPRHPASQPAPHTPEDTPEPRRTKRGTAHEAGPKHRQQQPDNLALTHGRPAPELHEQLQRTRGRRTPEGASGPRRSDSLAPNSDTGERWAEGMRATRPAKRHQQRATERVGQLPRPPIADGLATRGANGNGLACSGRGKHGHCERCGGLCSQRRAVSRETSSPTSPMATLQARTQAPCVRTGLNAEATSRSRAIASN